MSEKHPFDIRYQEKVDKVDWESCAKALDNFESKKAFDERLGGQ